MLSRAVVISVEGVSPKLGAEFITGLNEDVDYNDAYNAVAALGGNIGRAYESIAGGRLQKLTALVDDIAQKLASNNEYDLLKAVAPLTGNRQDTAAVLGMLKTVLRDAVAGGKRLSGLDNAVDALKGKSFLRFIMPRRSLSRRQIKMPIRHCSQQKSAIRCEERQADRRII